MNNGYKNQVINGQMCVWLQDWGFQPAKLGSEIRVGDVLVYNYGHQYTVVSIDKETEKTVTVSVKKVPGVRSLVQDNTLYPQKINKNTYKPVAN